MLDSIDFDLTSFRAQPLPSEHELMSGWNAISATPVVSVICVTYNHAEYLEDALRGFLLQKTNFKFEVVVYDDASKDGTSEIIQVYAKKYPTIIKPLIQTVNQYSQGRRPTQIAFKAAHGAFVALCEGDDIWIDRQKLQLQYEILKSKEISIAFHSAVELNVDTAGKRIIANHSLGDNFISLKDSVKGRGGFMPTASLFFRSELMEKNLAFFENGLPLGDFFLQMILSYSGKIYYFSRPMSLYRRNSVGSWTESQKNKENAKKYYGDMIEGIFFLHEYLKSKPESYLLAHPLFFYAKSFLIDARKPISSIFNLATLNGLSSLPFRGVCIYYYLLGLLPFRHIKKYFNGFNGAKK